MPIIQTETGYIYKKNVKNTKLPKPIKAFFIFVIVVVIIIGTFYLSSLFNITSVFGLNKYKIFDEKTYYAVSVVCGDSFDEVNDTSNEIKQKNGAGYVFKINNKYHVIANVYNLEQDALKVCENLTDYNAKVVNINFSQLVVSSEYTNEQLSALKTALDMVNRSFNKLYQTSLSLDKKEILEAEARQKLQVFKETCQEDKQSLTNTFKDNCDNLITNVKIFESEVISSIGALLLSENLSADIKYINALTAKH